MHILVTGGTGFIGSALCPQLLIDGHELTLLSRKPAKVKQVYETRVHVITRLTELDPDKPLDAVINLAGEGIADRPWTVARKQQLHASRITLTEELIAVLKRRQQRPSVLISGSAIGWYGNQGATLLAEKSPAQEEYMHTLCNDWENAAREAESLGIRVCLIRTGIVLAKNGGMLQKMLPMFKMGLGAKLGTGEQWLSWIAMIDYINIIRALLTDNSQSGIFNATAPHPVTNTELSVTLAKVLGRRAFLRIPEVMLRVATGEMRILFLGSQRVIPERLLNAGFSFRARRLEDYLRKELNNEKASSASA